MLLRRLLSLAEIDTDSNGFGSVYLNSVAANLDIGEIFCDSRQVVERGLYIALDGLHTDSHLFISDAVEHGAVAAVVSASSLSDGRVYAERYGIPLVAVDNCREAMARIYAAWYGNPQNKIKIIGVTGTNGKTSVCRMIYDILSRCGYSCGLIGTVGSRSPSGMIDVKAADKLANMTTPDPAELYRLLDIMQRDGAEYVIAEITSHALALKKVEPISFEIGIFTNLSEDHLDFHHDMESYFEAKSALFKRCRRAIINIDDKYGRRLAENGDICKYTCTCDGRAADFSASDIRANTQAGTEYKLSSSKMRLRVRTRAIGAVSVINSMQAAIACYCVGVAPHDIKESLSAIDGVCGRLERLKIDESIDFSVYIDYAHTPDALENLLRTARSFSRTGQRIVLVFGCGGDREKQKRPMMGRIASQMADFFVVTSDNSRSEQTGDIIDGIVSGIKPFAVYTVIEDRKKAIEYVIKNARHGDIVLLAGKGHEEYEIYGNEKRPFSERELVRQYVRKYYAH